jgi:hypothetical protein
MPRKQKNMEVSYGVEPLVNQSEASQDVPKKRSENLLNEIERMKEEGLTRTPEFRDKMKALEKILGVDQINPFGTNELDIFEKELSEMTNADIQSLAVRVGINPYNDRSQLKKILIKEFIASNRNNRRNVAPTMSESIQLNPNHPKYEEARKILGGF